MSGAGVVLRDTAALWVPCYCGRSEALGTVMAMSSVCMKAIRPELESRWPNLYADSPADDLW